MFRMQPANLVSTQSLNGTLILEQPLDFEEANLHTFKVCILVSIFIYSLKSIHAVDKKLCRV